MTAAFQPDFTGEHALARLIYRSRSTLGQSGREPAEVLRTLIDKARTNNEATGLSGVLLFDGQVFLQVLEGPLAMVERTYEKIACDQRHTDIEVIDLSPIQDREYGNWHMALVDAGRERFPALHPFMLRGSEATEAAVSRAVADVCAVTLESV